MEDKTCTLAKYSDKERAILAKWRKRIAVLSDFSLRTEDGGEFATHRLALVHASPYFRNLVYTSLSTSSVLIHGVQESILRGVLDYLYLKTVNITTHNICDLLAAADFFLIDGLIHECIRFLEENITVENCISFYLVSLALQHLGTSRLCYRYIQNNFEWVVFESKELHLLSRDELIHFLVDDYINVSGEETLWRGMVKWTEADLEARLEHVYLLLNCIRYPYLSRCFIDDIILNHQIVRKNIHCSRMMEESMKNPPADVFYQGDSMLELARRTGLTCVQTRVRKPKCVYIFAEVSFSIDDDMVNCKLYEMYDNQFDHWRKLASFTQFSVDFLHAIHGTLYIFDTYRNVIRAFSMVEKSWRFIPAMLDARTGYNVVCTNNKLYAIGGAEFILYQQTTAVEVYDPESDSWTRLAPMYKPHSGPAEVLNGKIFVIGDYFDECLKCYVICGEYYDLSTGTWTVLRSPKKYRRDFAMVTYDGFLYIIGGKDMKRSLPSVERYDPIANEWLVVKDMPCAFNLPRAVVLEGVLIVFESEVHQDELTTQNISLYWDKNSEEWKKTDPESICNELYNYLYTKIDDPEAIQRIRPFVSTKFQWAATSLG